MRILNLNWIYDRKLIDWLINLYFQRIKNWAWRLERMRETKREWVKSLEWGNSKIDQSSPEPAKKLWEAHFLVDPTPKQFFISWETLWVWFHTIHAFYWTNGGCSNLHPGPASLMGFYISIYTFCIFYAHLYFLSSLSIFSVFFYFHQYFLCFTMFI